MNGQGRDVRVTELFLKACRLEGERRRAFLDEACGGDDSLRAEVESLLAHDEKAAALLGTAGPGSETRPLDTDRLPDTHPEHVGPYRILRPLGEGGMGAVYLAEQDEPIRRRVALKLIKWGMDTREVISRFESERQALALMNHASIARVLDAGATDTGRPFFVMEYVQGVPITEHCDRQRLNTRERLELFAGICDAVQHAHQKGIIHRDIKPSNVLVTLQDDKPLPKVIDFGVAKATAQRLTETTLLTELGQVIGTPEYMSPEQAEMTAQDIDTRTDVYSLGVLLYELLTGALPLDPRELRRAGLDEIRRKIREEEPSKPSTRVSTQGAEAATAARNRRTNPGALARGLKGDLDWIVMKAIEKDRTRRYATPSELAADLRRHLMNEPVLAGPPGAAYRTRKFISRHRTGVLIAAVLLLGMVASTAGTGIGLARARRAERLAHLEAERANREAEAARELSEVLMRGFDVSDEVSLDWIEWAIPMLPRVLEEVDDQWFRARILYELARLNMLVWEFSRASEMAAESVAAYEAYGRRSDGLPRALRLLAASHMMMGHYEEARVHMSRELRLLQGRQGDRDYDEEPEMEALGGLAFLCRQLKLYEEAEGHLDRAVEIAERRSREDAMLELQLNRATLRQGQGRRAEGDALYRSAVDRARAEGVQEDLACDLPDYWAVRGDREKVLEFSRSMPLSCRALLLIDPVSAFVRGDPEIEALIDAARYDEVVQESRELALSADLEAARSAANAGTGRVGEAPAEAAPAP